MISKYFRLIVPACFLLVNVAGAGDSTVIGSTKISGYGSFQGGQVVKGISGGWGLPSQADRSIINHGWVQDLELGLFADSRINDHFHVILGPEVTVAPSFKGQYPVDGIATADEYGNMAIMPVISIGRAEGIWSFGNAGKSSYELEAGRFEYKYNGDVRNFGEYLFRTNIYPTTFYNKFDRPFAYLTGLRFGNTIQENFHHDLLITSELGDWSYPRGDISISYLANYKIPGIFAVGGGMSLFRCISVNKERTTPTENPTNTFRELINPKWHYDTTFHNWNVSGDSTFQSYAGTKLMGRISFDPTGLLPNVFNGKVLKSGDIKLYSEAAILGLTNYRFYAYSTTDSGKVELDTAKPYYDAYNDRIARTPIMVGLTLRLPFNILDVLDCEVEYLDSKYPNDFYSSFIQMEPIPSLPYFHAKYKWSVYAKKYLGTHASIIGQIANDHFIPITNSVNPSATQEKAQDYHDVIMRPGDWWWTLKMKFEI